MQGTLPGAAPACVPGELLLPGVAAGWEAIRIGQQETGSSPTMHVHQPAQNENVRSHEGLVVILSFGADSACSGKYLDCVRCPRGRGHQQRFRGHDSEVLAIRLPSYRQHGSPCLGRVGACLAPNTTSLKLPIVPSESSGLATSKVFGRVIGRSPSDFEYRYPQIESSVTLRVNRQSCIQ